MRTAQPENGKISISQRRPRLTLFYRLCEPCRMPERQPKYARIWRGRTTREKADAYQRYWLEAGTAPLIARGALSVQMLREDSGEYTEFTTISWWGSIDEMAPGGDPHKAHHLPRDREYLIELPERVQILTLLENAGSAP